MTLFSFPFLLFDKLLPNFFLLFFFVSSRFSVTEPKPESLLSILPTFCLFLRDNTLLPEEKLERSGFALAFGTSTGAGGGGGGSLSHDVNENAVRITTVRFLKACII